MSAPLRERIADTLTGGQLSEARDAADTAREQYREILSETRRLSRDVETMKEGGILAEDYASGDWSNRLRRDQQWLLISGYQQHRIIQKSDVDLYHDLLNYSYTFSPLIRGAIDLKTRYTFGLSFSIESDQDSNKKLIDAVMDDPRNKLAFFGSQAILEADHELQKGGNVYIAIWPKAKPTIQVRIWSSYEIGDIITDQNDADLPMFYIRSWIDSAGKSHKKAYPSIFNEKYDKIVNQAGTETEVDPDILVYHVSEGKGLKQKWALSPYTAALPWNRAYEGFLLDFAAIVQMIRKYTTMFTTKGGDAQVNALSTQFMHEQHGHHAAQIGNALITTEGNDFKVIDAGSNKLVGLQDSRQYLMQFCTAVGTPENLLTGNPQTGNRASAQELSTNFLPLIEERQTMWADAFKAIFTRILGDTEFDVSFPPLRSQDALTYLASLNSTAMAPTGGLTGIIRPIDLIKAAYESLDLKLPEDTTVEEMAAALLDRMIQNPDMAAAIDRLATATTKMQDVLVKV